MNLEPFITSDVKNAMFLHMQEGGEEETCGVIVQRDGNYAYERKANIHPERSEHYRFDKQTIAEINRDPAIVAFCHSHPRGPDIPSKHDMEVQAAVGKPSVLITRNPGNGIISVFSFGDHLLDLPLYNREFHYAVRDCFEGIRSWIWQNEGRKLKPQPRDDNWWNIGIDPGTKLEDNPDMYSRGFAAEGYEQFTPNFSDPNSEWHPRVGDVLLMQVGAPVCNHAGVYVGRNEVYHHRLGKKSCNNPIGYMWDKGYIRKWVRYGGSK